MTHPTSDTNLSQSTVSHITPSRLAVRPVSAVRSLAESVGKLFLARPQQSNSRTPSAARWCGALLWCAAYLAVCTGCGTAFTGGGIPTGRSTLMGKVVRADKPTVPVPNALVYLTITVMGKGVPGGRATNSYPFYTDEQGTFAAVNVPTDAVSSNASITVTTADTTLLGQKLMLSLTNNRPSSVIVALPPADFPLNKIASVKLTQQTAVAGPIPEAMLKAQVLDAAGVDLGIIPSLVFDGALASIATDGTINVVANPKVTNPVVGSPLGTVTATVDTHTSGMPPSTSVAPTLTAINNQDIVAQKGVSR